MLRPRKRSIRLARVCSSASPSGREKQCITSMKGGDFLRKNGVLEFGNGSFATRFSHRQVRVLSPMPPKAEVSYLAAMQPERTMTPPARAALGYLSGSLRYEVLKRAGFRPLRW